jgi:hypothetical protein
MVTPRLPANAHAAVGVAFKNTATRSTLLDQFRFKYNYMNVFRMIDLGLSKFRRTLDFDGGREDGRKDSFIKQFGQREKNANEE